MVVDKKNKNKFEKSEAKTSRKLIITLRQINSRENWKLKSERVEVSKKIAFTKVWFSLGHKRKREQRTHAHKGVTKYFLLFENSRNKRREL